MKVKEIKIRKVLRVYIWYNGSCIGKYESNEIDKLHNELDNIEVENVVRTKNNEVIIELKGDNVMKKQNHEFYAWNEFSNGAKVRKWTEPNPETNYIDILYNGKTSKVYSVSYKNGVRMLQVIGNRGCLGWVPAFTGEEYINGEKVRCF